MVMAMAVRVIMIVIVMAMAVRVIMVMMFLRFRITGSAYFNWLASISASTGVTHSYSFCSTSKDFICNSVPRISLTPIRWHSGQWLKTPSGV